MSNSLWDWATALYEKPGVASLCLRLQDEHGLDVDLVLACLWHVAGGGTMSEATLARLCDAAAPLQATITEVRAMRVRLGNKAKSDPRWRPTYEHAKATELAAERVELDRLEGALAGCSRRPTTAAQRRATAEQALRAYAERQGATVPPAWLSTLADAAIA